MATYKNIKSENEVTIKGLASVTGTASSGEGKLYFKTDGKPYALWEDGAEVDLSSDATGSFENVSGVVRNIGTHASDDFVFGASALNNYAIGEYGKFFFDKSKAAFRTGWSDNNAGEWDEANIGYYSFAAGADVLASGMSACSIGNGTTAAADYSTALGHATQANAVFSIAIGNQSATYLSSQFAFASNSSAQYSIITVNRVTSDATALDLTIDGGSPDSDNQLVVPARKRWKFRVDIIGTQYAAGTAGTAGDTAAYELHGIIKRDDIGNTEIVGSITKIVIEKDAGSVNWDINAAANNTNNSLQLTAQGETGKPIRWCGSIHLTEVYSS